MADCTGKEKKIKSPENDDAGVEGNSELLKNYNIIDGTDDEKIDSLEKKL